MQLRLREVLTLPFHFQNMSRKRKVKAPERLPGEYFCADTPDFHVHMTPPGENRPKGKRRKEVDGLYPFAYDKVRKGS